MYIWSPEVTGRDGRFTLRRKPSFSKTVMPIVAAVVLPTGFLLVSRGVDAAQRLGDPRGARLGYFLTGAFLLFLILVIYAGLAPFIVWEASREPENTLQLRRRLFGIPIGSPVRFDLRYLRLSHAYRGQRTDRFGNSLGEVVGVVARYRGQFVKVVPDLTPESVGPVVGGPLRRLIAMPADEVVWKDVGDGTPAISLAEFLGRVRTLIATLEAAIGAEIHDAALKNFLADRPDLSLHDLAWGIVDRDITISRSQMDELRFLVEGEIPPDGLPPTLADHVAE